jgi:hypothetical protein
MSRRFSAASGVLTAVTILVPASLLVTGQTKALSGKPPTTAGKWTPIKTPWGHPDLQGIWTSNGMAGVPLERDEEFGTRPSLTDAELTQRRARAEKAARDEKADRGGQVGNEQGPTHWYEWYERTSRATSLIIDPPDGKLPQLTPEGEKMEIVLGTNSPGPFNGPEDFNTWDRCITRGMPTAFVPTAYNNAYQIMQTPDEVVIFYELLHTFRVVPLAARPHVESRIRLWEGDSRGRWEGDTLVVDVTNFSDKTKGTLPPNGSSGERSPSGKVFTGTGASTHLVERFTRVCADTIHYEVRITDPTIYTKPWTMALDFGKDDRYQIFEYACHEGNRAVENSLRGSRAEERAAAAQKP